MGSETKKTTTSKTKSSTSKTKSTTSKTKSSTSSVKKTQQKTPAVAKPAKGSNKTSTKANKSVSNKITNSNSNSSKIKEKSSTSKTSREPISELKKDLVTEEGYEYFTKKEYDKLDTCLKCKKKIKSGTVKIDTNYVCGMCDYHREHPRHIYLCRECAKKLSDTVDKWLGKDYPTKF